MKLNAVGQENVARAMLGAMGLLFTGAGVTALGTAPHPGLKLFGAGFTAIGAGLMTLAGTGNFDRLSDTASSLATQCRLGLGTTEQPELKVHAA